MMANPLFNGTGQNPLTNIIQQAQEFKNQFANINPRAEVERLLKSGEMSQKTFNELSQIARQVVQFMEN